MASKSYYEQVQDDPRGTITTILDYILSGVSPSEYGAAHEDIDKLIANADADAELARLFTKKHGRRIVDYYRHLNPQDSSVNVVYGTADKFYDRGPHGYGTGLFEKTYGMAADQVKRENFIDMDEVIRELAKARNL